MEREQIMSKSMKIEISSESDSVTKFPVTPTSAMTQLTRQPSVTKSSCLCSPTSHAGSFRCRLHRAPTLQRTKSIDSASPRGPFSQVDATADDATSATISANI
ncbi:conserved hypothetical protein [Ricinus communis]|uniref:Serine-rich protein n=2 Tax=Ricinus communis TaxID=3988 RepID=B9SVL4_RICCO|nr:conserved hypothetical protein [Ricinus communis]